MAFNVPTQQPLTSSQNEALSKLNSMNNLLTIPFKQFFDKPKSKQISLLDFLTMIANAILGTGYIDTLILKFINDLFDKNSVKLEQAIIKALAGALDKKPITIKQGVSNKDWLTANVEPELHAAMSILKAVLIKRIMILIYGPKQRMNPMSIPTGTYDNSYLSDNGQYDDLNPDDYLDNASLSDVMFTTVNTESNSFGDVEMNIVKLKQQLEKGQVTFTVSCQDIKINLPESILQSADDAIGNNVLAYFQGPTVGGGPQTYQNPTKVLVELTGHVDSEVQRINNEENVSAVRKSWLRILLDKIINLLPLVLYPVLRKVLGKINTEIQNDTGVNPELTVENTLGLAVAIKNGLSDKNLFEKNSVFYKIMMNAIYSIVLALILKKLIPKITKLITKALAKKRSNDLMRKTRRLRARAKLLQEQSKEIEKKAIAAKALTVIKPIINYVS
jgi:hypothetical protein